MGDNNPKKKKHAPRPQPELTYEEALYLAWKRGLLEYLLLPHQKDLYKIIGNPDKRKTAINSSRRFGKTTTLLIYCLEFGIKNPGSLIRFIAPTQKTLRKNIFPIIRELLLDCPIEFMPKWNSQEGCYQFPNGSEMHIYGTDNQQHDSLRGQRTELAVVDEAAYCSDLKYIVQDVLLPQTLTCGGRIILASTPQKKTTQSGEEFKEFCSECELNEAYHTKTIYDNTSLSQALIEEYCKESGGENSITWRVEYLCEFIIDPEKRIIPEWDSSKYVQEIKHPDMFAYFHTYVALDLGVRRDFTCILFAYYDFLQGKLVILDEITMKNMTSTQLIDAMKAKENLYFSNKVYRRVADTDNPLLLNDMCSLHGLPVIPTSKTTLESMVNETRVWINSGKVIVHPRCKFTIGCLEKGVWSDSMQGQLRKDFGRTSAYGHFDAIAALNYLVRNIDTSTNPIPEHLGVDFTNAFVVGESQRKTNGQELQKLFKRKK